jgi:pyruvate formate lyase activating enzyme
MVKVQFEGRDDTMIREGTSLRESLAQLTRRGELYRPLEHDGVLCYACGHRCKILVGRDGICKVRFNQGGTLMVPHGYVAGLAADPIEKKPFFHVLPGSLALSFGMLGCDYHCDYCQNWLSSQTLRDPASTVLPEVIGAEQIVAAAVQRRIPVITSTYNEPLITTEWAVEIFRLARRHGIRCSYVSNGNATPEVLEYLRPFIDCYKIDLKSFRQKTYQQLGGRLQVVLDTITGLHRMGVWIEVVTLIVPGLNDAPEELGEIAGFLAGVSPDIPWHVTAFHPDYRMTDPPPTTVQSLITAAEIGRSNGLRFVYAGNVPGRSGSLENTVCPSCGNTLVERRGFTVTRIVMRSGICGACGTTIPGIWQ